MLKKIFNRKTVASIILIGTLTILFGAMSFAQGEQVKQYIDKLTDTIRYIAVAFVALAACTTAILYMVGTVNPKLKDKSKDALYALIIGVIILVMSNNIAGWIANLAGQTINSDGSMPTTSSSNR